MSTTCWIRSWATHALKIIVQQQWKEFGLRKLTEWFIIIGGNWSSRTRVAQEKASRTGSSAQIQNHSQSYWRWPLSFPRQHFQNIAVGRRDLAEQLNYYHCDLHAHTSQYLWLYFLLQYFLRRGKITPETERRGSWPESIPNSAIDKLWRYFCESTNKAAYSNIK